jgi:serine/threonine protein kinase
MKNNKLTVGSKLGKWRLAKVIAQTPHSLVWQVVEANGTTGALKLVRDTSKKEAVGRFADEIAALHACQDISGVLPLLDSHVPTEGSQGETAWLVTAHAVSLSDEANFTLEETVRLCLSLAETLDQMHGRGYSHRDIKPSNIFRFADKWCLGDFGLVDFPGKQGLTQNGRRLGPALYIAPEMLNEASEAIGKSADVYSLGKLLWKLATAQRYPVPGVHQRSVPALTISAVYPNVGAGALDVLLESMTLYDPAARLSMAAVHAELREWLAPAPNSESLTDLRYLRNRIDAITEGHQQQQERRQLLEAAADQARATTFKAFSKVMAQIKTELEAAVSRVSISAPSGGNAHFYRALPGQEKIGSDDNIWMFEFRLEAEIIANGKRGQLKGGVNLGIRRLPGSTLHDINAQVLAAAGYVVDADRVESGVRRKLPTIAWVEAAQFRFGHPSETVAVESLKAALLRNLRPAVEGLIFQFEALDAE